MNYSRKRNSVFVPFFLHAGEIAHEREGPQIKMDDKDVVTLVLFVFSCFSLGKKEEENRVENKIPKLFLLLLFGSVCVCVIGGHYQWRALRRKTHGRLLCVCETLCDGLAP